MIYLSDDLFQSIYLCEVTVTCALGIRPGGPECLDPALMEHGLDCLKTSDGAFWVNPTKSLRSSAPESVIQNAGRLLGTNAHTQKYIVGVL